MAFRTGDGLEVNGILVVDAGGNIQSVPSVAINQAKSAMDSTNLKFEVNGDMSVRAGGYLYQGITSNNINSWKTRIGNGNSSTLYINSQGLQVDNTGYANPALIFLKANASGVDGTTFRDLDNTAYYANPAGTSVFNGATFAATPTVNGNTVLTSNAGINANNINSGTINTNRIPDFVHLGNSTTTGYATDDGSWGSRLNVSSTVHAKIEVSQEANSMRSHWFAHTGQDSIKFGTSTAHDVEFQRGGATKLELTSDAITFSGPINMNGNNIRRGNHHTGHLEGSYSNIGGNGSKSNPIYTIGSSYNPSDAALGNMYGIGFADTGSSPTFLPGSFTGGWGMYVASGGTARVYLGGGTGDGNFLGNLKAAAFYDIDNTAYYTNPAATSEMIKLNLHYSQVWSETTQGGGTGSLHLDPNSATDHAGGAITFGASDTSNGTNAHAGIYVRSDGSYGTKMYLSTTDSYGQGSKTALKIDHTGVVSSTRSRISSASDMRASVFYDSSNTDFYVDPVGSSKLYGSLMLGHTNSQAGSLVIYDTGNNALEIKGTGSNTFEFDLTGTGSTGSVTFNQFNDAISGNLTVNGSLAGKSDNTTEIGTYSTGAIKRIRMAQGGELHFGDTTTSSPLGITEGAWDNFADQDRMSIYYRNSLKFFTGTSEKAQLDNAGKFSTVSMLASPKVQGGTTSTLTSAGNLAVYDTGNPYISFHTGTARTAYMQELSGRFYFGEVPYTESVGSFRAPVFYDSDNANYYLDPSSTGTSLNVAGNAIIPGYARIAGVELSAGDTVSLTGAANNQWVTVANFTGSRKADIIEIYDNESSRHNYVKIEAGWSYGQGSIQILNAVRHGNRTINQVRMLYNTADRTYGTGKLQVYMTNWNTSYTLKIKQLGFGRSGWGRATIPTSAENGLPSGYTIHETTAMEVNEDPNGTFGTTGRAVVGQGIDVFHGSPIKFHTTSGDGISTERGFIDAQEGGHLRIATSGGENIVFKDGGVSGTTNLTLLGTGEMVKEATERFTIKSHSNGWEGGMRMYAQNGSTIFQMHPDNNGHMYVDQTWRFSNNTLGSGYGRLSHHTGHLVGGYNNVGSSGGKSSPIYTIGSSYNPTDASISGMYGIGYTTYSASLMNTALAGATDWGMYVAANGTGRVWLDGHNGNISSAGSVYASAFYDSNNANYYLNPASTSFLDSISVKIGAENTGAANSSTIGLIMRHGGSSYNNNTWAHKFHKHDHGGGVPMYLSETIGTGAWSGMQRWGSYSGDNYKNVFFSALKVVGSVDADAFYDRDNTSYYVNPTGESVLYGDLRFDNYGSGIVGKYSSTVLQTLFAMGSAYNVSDNGSSASNAYGLFYTHPNAGTLGGANQLDSHGFVHLEGGTFKGGWGGGTIIATNNMKAQKFYDRDDTQYFMDLSTNDNSLVMRGTIHVGPEGNIGLGHLTHPKRVIPGAAAAWAGSGTTTGQIVIDLPGSLANYDMLYFEVDVYEYSSKNATKIIVGGHNWNSGGNSAPNNQSWHNVGVKVIGDMDKPIYFGWRNNGSVNKRVMVIGEPASSWSYGTVRVSSVSGADDFYIGAIDYTGDWAVTQSTSSSVFTKSPTTDFNSVGTQTLKTHGRMQAYGYQGNGNVGGTGSASWHPSGVYSNGTNWLYGQIVMNNNYISGCRYIAVGADYSESHILRRNNANNTEIRTHASGTAGLLVRNGSDQFRFQLYGDGTNYGFLDNTWGSWDLQKTTNGHLYMNENTGYYLNPPTSSYLNNVTIAGQLNMSAGNYEGSIVFGGVDAWHTGIRQHDDADAELRIWAANSNGRIHIATGYNGEPASISRPTDGFVVDHNNVGIGPGFQSIDPSEKLHVIGNMKLTGNLIGNANSATFKANTVTSYGSWCTSGSRGGYDGIVFDNGGDAAIMFDGSGNGGAYRQSGGGWYYYFHVGNNCLGLNESTTSSSYGAYLTGAFYATGNITAYSDRRVKENIVQIDNALEKVNKLEGVYYNRIDDESKTKEIGFIAQDVNEVAPELVTYAEDVDQYGVKYGNTTALLVEAVKELTQQVKDLKQEIKEIKNVK